MHRVPQASLTLPAVAGRLERGVRQRGHASRDSVHVGEASMPRLVLAGNLELKPQALRAGPEAGADLDGLDDLAGQKPRRPGKPLLGGFAGSSLAWMRSCPRAGTRSACRAKLEI
jgi:hypothetical protein